MVAVDAPGYLTASQRGLWEFYAPQLIAEGRLPLKSRDALAKYVVAVDIVSRLNAGLETDVDQKSVLVELRQWLMVTRLYESDLLLNPAAAIRAPATDQPSADPDDVELDAILN